MIAVVQFTHPGGEHTLSRDENKKGNIKQWNYDGHKRKFIKTTGVCIDESCQPVTNRDLLFWGEWEPASIVTQISPPPSDGRFPTVVHEPILELDKKGEPLAPYYGTKIKKRKGIPKKRERQNTDPFVFADGFYYCCCKQPRFRGLRDLETGSIILFGSTVSKERGGKFFELDTVFVVDDYRCYTPGTYTTDLKGFIPPKYDKLMGFSNWSDPKQDFVCFKGATFRDRDNFAGMFSYAPCKKCDGIVIGFPKVKIDSSSINSIFSSIDIINDKLFAAPKYSIMASLRDSKRIWDEISRQVDAQGYLKGIQFNYKTIIK